MPRIPKFFMARLPVELQPKTWMYAAAFLAVGVGIGWAVFAPSRTSAVERQVTSINDLELRSLMEFERGVETRKILDSKLDMFAVQYGKQVKDWETHKAKSALAVAQQIPPENQAAKASAPAGATTSK
jgi:hypothetical protein